jgi:hypothetical protein
LSSSQARTAHARDTSIVCICCGQTTRMISAFFPLLSTPQALMKESSKNPTKKRAQALTWRVQLVSAPTEYSQYDHLDNVLGAHSLSRALCVLPALGCRHMSSPLFWRGSTFSGLKSTFFIGKQFHFVF